MLFWPDDRFKNDRQDLKNIRLSSSFDILTMGTNTREIVWYPRGETSRSISQCGRLNISLAVFMEAVVTPTMVTDLNSHRQKPSGLGFPGPAMPLLSPPSTILRPLCTNDPCWALSKLRRVEVSEGNPVMNVANQGLHSGLLWYAC